MSLDCEAPRQRYQPLDNVSTVSEPWKVGLIITLLKPGKPTGQSKSFRPIALLSLVAKIVEYLLIPRITENTQLADHQHELRKGKLTTTALKLIIHAIGSGTMSQNLVTDLSWSFLILQLPSIQST